MQGTKQVKEKRETKRGGTSNYNIIVFYSLSLAGYFPELSFVSLSLPSVGPDRSQELFPDRSLQSGLPPNTSTQPLINHVTHCRPGGHAGRQRETNKIERHRGSEAESGRGREREPEHRRGDKSKHSELKSRLSSERIIK